MKRKYETIGIDLGTTYCAVGYVDDHGEARVVHNPEDQRPIVPSVVFFDGDDIIVGENALSNASVYPNDVVLFAKRDIGEPTTYVMGRKKKKYTPETISALVLKKLVQISEPTIGKVNKVVITVPAFFNEKRRSATEHAGKIAGLEVVATLNEPSAALIAYGLHETDAEKFYVVYDLGGGTFDVTVMKVGRSTMQELATGGNRKLGGCDWDEALVNHVAEEFVKECGADPRDDAISFQTLLSDCRQAKRRLSELQRTVIRCMHAGKAHNVEVTREKFERMTKRLLSKTEMTIEACIRDASLSWDKIDGVALVGGSTRMPMVRKMIKRISGKDPLTSVDAELAVATGAAVYGGVLETRGPIEDAQMQTSSGAGGDEPDRSGGSGEKEADDDDAPLPVSFDDTPAPVLESAGPADDEGVTFATEFSGNGENGEDDDVDDLQVVDLRLVNSHGIGVFARKGDQRINVVMIPKNSQLPLAETRLFRTARDGMQQLKITITEGDTEHPEGCEVLGKCILGPLPSSLKKGSPVELQIGYGKDGRVRVSAVSKTTGTQVHADIEADGILSEQQVEQERGEFATLDVV